MYEVDTILYRYGVPRYLIMKVYPCVSPVCIRRDECEDQVNYVCVFIPLKFLIPSVCCKTLSKHNEVLDNV